MHQSAYTVSTIIRSLLVAVALLTFSLPGNAAIKCDAASFVIGAGKTYDQAARIGSAAALANGIDRYSDMRSFAMFALGRYRGKLPKSREAEFVRLTKTFMGKFMQKNGKNFRVGTLNVVGCSGSGSNITVNARTAAGASVSFRLAKTGSGYIVRDMRANSIWLVQQMRSTFVGTINRNNGDIDALFSYLKRY